MGSLAAVPAKIADRSLRLLPMTARQPLSPAPLIDHDRLLTDVAKKWDDEIVPQLIDYVRIPAKSPGFDRGWAQHGYLDQAVALAEKGVRRQNVPGMTLEVVRLEGRTPVLFFDIPATGGLARERT